MNRLFKINIFVYLICILGICFFDLSRNFSKNELLDSVIHNDVDIFYISDKDYYEEYLRNYLNNLYNSKLDSISSSLNENELNEVKIRINSIIYEDIKNSLNERVNSIMNDINIRKTYTRLNGIDLNGPRTRVPTNVNVIGTYVGKITAYTAYCVGCYGYTASGKFVGNGNIFQTDREFGEVYIVAGDSSLPFGTIVRIKGLNYFGKDIYAMVLDRGGGIGFNRGAMFDLLFASDNNMNKFGVQYNVTFEILRLGY